MKIMKKHWVFILSSLVSSYIILVGSIVSWNFNPDDAYRYFHVAKNIYNGFGVRWNIIDAAPSQSFTSFPWIMILVLLKALTNLSFITISKIVGIISTIFAIILAKIFVYRETKFQPIQSLFLIISFVSLPVVYFHAVNGMDTALQMLFITFVSIYFLLSWNNKKYLNYFFLFTLLAFLVRYESVLSSGVLFLSLLYKHKNYRNDYIIKSLLYLIIPGLIYFGWKIYYFGGIFPNSFYVKTAETIISPSGLNYFVENFSRFFAIGIVGFLCLFPYNEDKNKKSYFILLMSILLQLIFIVRIIPTVGQGGRFVFPYIPTFLIIITMIVIGTLLKNRNKTIFNRLILFITIGFLFIGTHLDSRRNHFRLMRNVASTRVYDPVIGKAFMNVIDNPEDIVISTGESGAISFFSDFTLVDIWGLHDAYIAKNGLDLDYVYSYKPDVFTTFIPKNVVNESINNTVDIDLKYMKNYIEINRQNKNTRGHTAYSSFLIMVDERFMNYDHIRSIPIQGGKEWIFFLRKDSKHYSALKDRIDGIDFISDIEKVQKSMKLKRYAKALLGPFNRSNYMFIDSFYE